MLTNLAKAPFPWFGGKSQAAPLVWSLLGDVDHYCEPFAGSLAVLLNRPHPCNRQNKSETVNDLDGFVVNAWRAMQQHPDETADAASWPVTEADKSARQLALLRWRDETGLPRLAGDATFCDPVMAGWWLWSVSVQIGAFDGRGPWVSDPVTGRITKAANQAGVTASTPEISNDGRGSLHPGTRQVGVSAGIPHLSGDGQGVYHPGTRETGVNRNRPQLPGRGVSSDALRAPGVGAEFHPVTMPELVRWFRWLSARLRHVRIINGDWSRLVKGGAMFTLSVRSGGVAGVFLDPPYAGDIRAKGLYAEDSHTVARDVLAWCLTEHAHDPRLRVVLAGFDTEHTALEAAGWTVHEWFTAGFLRGGMANRGDGGQQHRERLWASPNCLDPTSTPQLFHT